MKQGRQGAREALKRAGKEGRIRRKGGMKTGREERRQEERGKGGNEVTREGCSVYM